MDKHLFYALLGGAINVVLSSSIPCLINKKDKSFFGEMKQVYETNRKSILVSSLIIVITIYVVLKIGPSFKPLLERLSNEDNSNNEYEPSVNQNIIRLSKGMMPLNNFIRF
jgi:hypothetical protein